MSNNKKILMFIKSVESSLESSDTFVKYNYFRLWLEKSLSTFKLPAEHSKGLQARHAVLLFGSAVAGTSLSDGDADFSLAFYSTSEKNPLIEIEREHQEHLLSNIFRTLNCEEIRTQRIFRARVPVVNFSTSTGKFPNFKFDLSLSVNGVRNSLLLRQYMLSNSRLHLGCLLAKKWGRTSNILNSRGGWISPYALSILYIYYFQTVQQIEFLPESDVNTKLNEIIQLHHAGKYSNIEELNSSVKAQIADLSEIPQDLAGFFDFYSNFFDFDSSVVDIRRESKITSKDVWMEQLSSRPQCERWNLLGHENCFIRDPFEAHNLGRSVDFLKCEHIREAFRVASRKHNPVFFLEGTL